MLDYNNSPAPCHSGVTDEKASDPHFLAFGKKNSQEFMLVNVRMDSGEPFSQMLENEALVALAEAEMLGNEGLVPF